MKADNAKYCLMLDARYFSNAHPLPRIHMLRLTSISTMGYVCPQKESSFD
jgi:hypothetical protein